MLCNVGVGQLPQQVPHVLDLAVSGCNDQLGSAGKPAFDHRFQVVLERIGWWHVIGNQAGSWTRKKNKIVSKQYPNCYCPNPILLWLQAPWLGVLRQNRHSPHCRFAIHAGANGQQTMHQRGQSFCVFKIYLCSGEKQLMHFSLGIFQVRWKKWRPRAVLLTLTILTCALWEIKAHAALSWPPAIARCKAVRPCESRWSMSSFWQIFFRANYHCFGWEISLDERIEIFKRKIDKIYHDSNPNLCCCLARRDMVLNEKLCIPQRAKTQTSSSQFVHWPSVCTILQENLHQSRVPLLRRLMQDRVLLVIQKLLPETNRQNSWKLSGWLNLFDYCLIGGCKMFEEVLRPPPYYKEHNFLRLPPSGF